MSVTLRPETRALLTLQLVPGLGPQLTAALVERFGSAEQALQADLSQLLQVPRIGKKLAQAIVDAPEQSDVDGELRLLEELQVRLLSLSNSHYPEAIRAIHAPPPLLYIRGSFEPCDRKAVAIVGMRNCTEQGRRIAHRMAKDLCEAGYTVVSGLARGIDAAAHRGALEAGGRTIAVMAGGLAKIYPPEHADLARQVTGQGVLLSESALRQSPIAAMFPARNRLISGLSLAVVLVEAGAKSGARITATHAVEQGKSVLAVPGPIDAETSAGTNALIREGAVLCRGVDDILEELEGVRPEPMPLVEESAPPPSAKPSEPPPSMDEDQKRVWELLGNGDKHLDELVQESGIDAGKLSGILLVMEMKRWARRLPGNRFERA